MAILEIYQYPNPILREVAQPVSMEALQSEAIQQLIRDMVETMYAFEGTVGLAATQVGHPVEIFVMDSTAKTTKDRCLVLVNPEITQQSRWKYSREGCLSFPNYLVTVKRARKISTRWRTPEGVETEQTFEDVEAIIAQHEIDHLKGILFIDRMQDPQNDLVLRQDLPHKPTETSSSETQ